MRYVNDDYTDSELTGEAFEMEIPDYPAELEVMGFFNDPLLSDEIDALLEEAELMGIDLDDPELMGAWLKKLVGKIRSNFRKRRGKGKKAPVSASVSTPQGSAAIGPGGITWTAPPGASMPMVQPSGGGIADMLKNPMVIAGVGGVALLLFMQMRKK